MSYTDTAADASLSELVEHFGELPVAPGVEIQLLTLLDRSSTTAQELGKTIQLDAVLAARVLELANCAAFGLYRDVRNVTQAVVLLGVTTLRSLAAMRFVASTAGGNSPELDHFRQHAVATASGASAAARYVGASPADALCAGLVHDLGTMVMSWSNRMPSEPTAPHGEHVPESAFVLEALRFPTDLVDAVLCLHGARRPETPLARALVVGEALARELGHGDTETSTPLMVALGEAGLGLELGEELLEACEAHVAELLSSFRA